MNAGVAVPALLVVLLSGCAAGTDAATGSAQTSPPPATPTAGTSAVPTPSAAATSPTPAVRTVEVTYAGGQVTGTSGREQVPLGEQVVLRITSDVREEVHVHGYDLVTALPAGSPVDIPVTATIPGVFEVELHDSGRVLFQLRVA